MAGPNQLAGAWRLLQKYVYHNEWRLSKPDLGALEAKNSPPFRKDREKMGARGLCRGVVEKDVGERGE